MELNNFINRVSQDRKRESSTLNIFNLWFSVVKEQKRPELQHGVSSFYKFFSQHIEAVFNLCCT
jgi:hypothetical protein